MININDAKNQLIHSPEHQSHSLYVKSSLIVVAHHGFPSGSSVSPLGDLDDVQVYNSGPSSSIFHGIWQCLCCDVTIPEKSMCKETFVINQGDSTKEHL